MRLIIAYIQITGEIIIRLISIIENEGGRVGSAPGGNDAHQRNASQKNQVPLIPKTKELIPNPRPPIVPPH